jgi:hypothetical protein
MTTQTARADRLHTFGQSRPASTPWRSLLAFHTHVRQWLCGLKGHERYLHTEAGRMTLRCVGCGLDSPGWDTSRRAYQITYAGDPVRHRIR